MKKLFLLSLLIPTIIYASDSFESLKKDPLYVETLAKIENELKNPEYLKFILGNQLDLHFYGALTPIVAQNMAKDIHENLIWLLMIGKNHFEAGECLCKDFSEEPDAVIVNTCTTIEERLRKDGEAGNISGKDLSGWMPSWLISSCSFDGTKFFEKACPCDFYKNLSNEELEQLRKSTQR